MFENIPKKESFQKNFEDGIKKEKSALEKFRGKAGRLTSLFMLASSLVVATGEFKEAQAKDRSEMGEKERFSEDFLPYMFKEAMKDLGNTVTLGAFKEQERIPTLEERRAWEIEDRKAEIKYQTETATKKNALSGLQRDNELGALVGFKGNSFVVYFQVPILNMDSGAIAYYEDANKNKRSVPIVKFQNDEFDQYEYNATLDLSQLSNVQEVIFSVGYNPADCYNGEGFIRKYKINKNTKKWNFYSKNEVSSLSNFEKKQYFDPIPVKQNIGKNNFSSEYGLGNKKSETNYQRKNVKILEKNFGISGFNGNSFEAIFQTQNSSSAQAFYEDPQTKIKVAVPINKDSTGKYSAKIDLSWVPGAEIFLTVGSTDNQTTYKIDKFKKKWEIIK